MTDSMMELIMKNEEYSPQIGDDVEVYKSNEGNFLKSRGKRKRKKDIVRGRVAGVGSGPREGMLRVTMKVPWGETSGWYWPWQLRRA